MRDHTLRAKVYGFELSVVTDEPQLLPLTTPCVFFTFRALSTQHAIFLLSIEAFSVTTTSYCLPL